MRGSSCRFSVVRFVVLASLCMGLGVYSTAQQSTELHLTILHTNDTHGHLLPFSYPDVVDPGSEIAMLPIHRDIGGAARRATLVKKIRAEKDHQTLLIDAGDICDGTPFSTEYHGDADVAAMNAIGYDIACPGNHEYNNSIAQIKKLAGEARFALISANSTYKSDGKSPYTPYIIRNVEGVRIAFFGLLTYEARTYPGAREGIQVEQPIEAACKLVPELKKISDLVVAVTHIGVDEDIKLAAEVPGIDIIVGGHSHTLLPHPVIVPHPLDRSPFSIHGTLIVQDFQWGSSVGRLDLIIHHVAGSRASVERYSGSLLPVTSAQRDDPTVATLIDRYWKPIASKYGRIVGEAAADFAEKGQDLAEYNLVADAVRDQLGVEFEMENPGGVRSMLIHGPITYGDMVTLDPFGNTVVTFHATGKQIKAMLLTSRPAVSGIQYTIDHGVLKRATIAGNDIEDSRTYVGATNSYLAQTLLKDIKDKSDTGKMRLDTVLVYLQNHRPVKPAYDGRRIIVE